jgi:hypothetical protein
MAEDAIKCGNCGNDVERESGLFMYAGSGSTDDSPPVGAWCDWACMAADVTSKYGPTAPQD